MRTATFFRPAGRKCGSVSGATSASTRALAPKTGRSNASARRPLPGRCRVVTSARTSTSPCAARDAHDVGVADAEVLRIGRVDFDERLGDMLRQARAFAGARHGVPMVAHAAGVERPADNPALVRVWRPRARRRRSAPCGRRDRSAPSAKKRVVASALRAGRLRPLERRQRFVGRRDRSPACAPMSKSRAAVVLEGRQRGVLGEDLGRRRDRRTRRQNPCAWPPRR